MTVAILIATGGGVSPPGTGSGSAWSGWNGGPETSTTASTSPTTRPTARVSRPSRAHTPASRSCPAPAALRRPVIHARSLQLLYEAARAGGRRQSSPWTPTPSRCGRGGSPHCSAFWTTRRSRPGSGGTSSAQQIEPYLHPSCLAVSVAFLERHGVRFDAAGYDAARGTDTLSHLDGADRRLRQGIALCGAATSTSSTASSEDLRGLGLPPRRRQPRAAFLPGGRAVRAGVGGEQPGRRWPAPAPLCARNGPGRLVSGKSTLLGGEPRPLPRSSWPTAQSRLRSASRAPWCGRPAPRSPSGGRRRGERSRPRRGGRGLHCRPDAPGVRAAEPGGRSCHRVCTGSSSTRVNRVLSSPPRHLWRSTWAWTPTCGRFRPAPRNCRRADRRR